MGPFPLGISGQLLFDLENIESKVTNAFGSQDFQAEPTNIISNGKLCDPDVQQYSGHINFSGSGGEKSYFFWLLESRSNPVTDPLVVWLSGGPGKILILFSRPSNWFLLLFLRGLLDHGSP